MSITSSSTFLLLADVLVPEQRPLPRHLVIDDRFRVPQFLELAPGHGTVRIVYGFSFEVLELRHPISDVVAVGIAFLRLGVGVEDPLDTGEVERRRRERALTK